MEDPQDEVVQEIDFEDNAIRSPLRHENIGFASPHRKSPVKLTFEETGSLSASMKVLNTDITTLLGDSLTLSIPEQTILIPPEVSMGESILEEV